MDCDVNCHDIDGDVCCHDDNDDDDRKLVEHPAKGSLVGTSLTSSSVEDGGLDCLNELGLKTLALRDPSVV